MRATEINPIRQRFPSLYAASVSAIQWLDPIKLGQFISMIRRCASTTAALLLQDPDASQLSAWPADIYPAATSASTHNNNNNND
jgi:hypothetical protein